MTAGGQQGRKQLSVPLPTYDELVRRQEEWEAEHPGGTISLGAIIAQLLAAHTKAVQP